MEGLNSSIVKNLKFVIPPIDEQKEISIKLLEESKLLEKMIGKYIKKSSLLNQYRQSLISSVVTGKIRITEDMIWVQSLQTKKDLKSI